MSAYIHIHAPAITHSVFTAECCPDCQRPEPAMVREFTDGYNDPEVICLCCGESWSGGYLWPKPFERGWRQRRIAQVIAAFNAERGIM